MKCPQASMTKCYRYTFLLLCTPAFYVKPARAQPQHPGDYFINYGANYSTRDRKATVPVSWYTPANFTYQLVCELALAVDDDVVSTSNGATGWDTGIGNLGFEAHFTPKFLGGGYDPHAKQCLAATKPALTFDYVVTVPVPSTVESTELAHLAKATFTGSLAGGNILVTAGANVSGVTTGGYTTNAVLSSNFTRPLTRDQLWMGELETDLASASATAPSSAIFLIAFDRLNHAWLVHFGSSFGLTPYAPKASFFVNFSYHGNLPIKKPRYASILRY